MKKYIVTILNTIKITIIFNKNMLSKNLKNTKT